MTQWNETKERERCERVAHELRDCNPQGNLAVTRWLAETKRAYEAGLAAGATLTAPPTPKWEDEYHGNDLEQLRVEFRERLRK